MEASRKNLFSISLSQFGAAFSHNFITVFLPFFIFKISPHSPKDTLVWVGAIMGSATLGAAATSPFWGSLTHRYSPKSLYIIAFMANIVTFLLMGFTTDLLTLLILRIFQGLMGGTSTIGLIILSAMSPKEKVTADIGLFQSSMTLGQLVGPLLGSLAAATLGYKWAFIGASVLMFLSLVFCHLYVMDVPRLPRMGKAAGGTALDKRTLVAWVLCFTAVIQLTFLPSVLPNVFEKFNIERSVALRMAGTVVMLYTATAMLGTYGWSRLSRKVGLYRMIGFLFILGILLQALLAFSRGIVDFTLIRMAQTGIMAATLPLIMSAFVGESRGSIIGFLNSSRFAGNAVGPMIATGILALTDLTTVYLFISGFTLCVFLGFKLTFKEAEGFFDVSKAG